MRAEEGSSSEAYLANPFYREYIGMFAPVNFVNTQEYSGRYRVLRLGEDCWESPEGSFSLRLIDSKEYLDFRSSTEVRERLLLHPETYTALLLFMQRAGLIGEDRCISPTVFCDGDNAFISESERAFPELTFRVVATGKFDISKDEHLWDLLEKDAMHVSDLRRPGGWMRRTITRLKEESDDGFGVEPGGWAGRLISRIKK